MRGHIIVSNSNLYPTATDVMLNPVIGWYLIETGEASEHLYPVVSSETKFGSASNKPTFVPVESVEPDDVKAFHKFVDQLERFEKIFEGLEEAAKKQRAVIIGLRKEFLLKYYDTGSIG